VPAAGYACFDPADPAAVAAALPQLPGQVIHVNGGAYLGL
jgi:hypothetical protein